MMRIAAKRRRIGRHPAGCFCGSFLVCLVRFKSFLLLLPVQQSFLSASLYDLKRRFLVLLVHHMKKI